AVSADGGKHHRAAVGEIAGLSNTPADSSGGSNQAHERRGRLSHVGFGRFITSQRRMCEQFRHVSKSGLISAAGWSNGVRTTALCRNSRLTERPPNARVLAMTRLSRATHRWSLQT